MDDNGSKTVLVIRFIYQIVIGRYSCFHLLL